MKRVAWILAGIALAGALLVALMAVLLPWHVVARQVGQQISAWTGRDVALRGEPEFSFFPRLVVSMKDVQVGGPEGMNDAAVVTMERLEGQLRLWPLFIGRFEIGSFTMVRPLIRLVREGGDRNWAFDSGAAALQLAFAGDVLLGEFTIEDGTVVYENRGERLTERIDSLNLQVAWPSVRQPLSLQGSGIWRGAQVALSASAATPFAYLNGGVTPVEISVDSAPLAIRFSGQGSDVNNPRLDGSLAMSTPSLRNFAAWLGSPVGPGSTLGPASLAGAASFTGNILSVENGQLALDGNTASGALSITVAAVPDVTGTLAFPEIDLTPYFAGFAAAFQAGEDWRGVTIATDWFGDISADIRLSAGSVRLGQLRLGETAASVSLAERRLEIGVGQAAFNGGSVTGVLTVAHPEGATESAAQAQLRADGVNLAEAGPALGLPSPVSGKASLRLDLAARGPDLGSLVNSVTGTASLTAENGAFPLFGIAEIAAAGGAAAPQRVGMASAAPVQKLSVAFAFADQAALIDPASVATPTFGANARGRIGLTDGTLRLDGTVTPAQGSGSGAPIPFAVTGTLREPVAAAAPAN